MRRLTCSLAVALFTLGSASTAVAQGDTATAPPAEKPAEKPADEDVNVSDADKARATKLFDEGRALTAEGKYDEACAKFEASHKLRPGIGVLFNLADCNEKRGRSATAFRQFTEVAERTKAALQEDREKVARERLVKLEKKIARLRIVVTATNKVKLVKLDGEKVEPSDYNQPVPIDPGEHTVYAETTTDDGEPFEESFDAPAAGNTVTVTIPIAPGAKMKRRVPMIIGGGVTAGVGVILLGAGAYVLAADAGFGDGVGLGAGLIALSVVHMAVGFPIFGVGFKKKPVYDNKADVVPVYEPSPVPHVGLGLGSANLTWQF